MIFIAGAVTMKRILVLDDEEMMRGILRKLLVSEGYDVMEASNAHTAHEILKRENMDLVLLDIKMPDVSGSELYAIIEQFHRTLRVIVTSVYPLDVQRQIIPGACDYYDKAQGIDLLIAKIKRALIDGTITYDRNE